VRGTGQVYFFFYLSLNRETSVRDKWNSHCFFPLCLPQLSPILYSLPFNPLISIWWQGTTCEVAECVRQASEFKLNQCLCYRIQLQTCYCRQDQIPTEGYNEFLNPVIPMQSFADILYKFQGNGNKYFHISAFHPRWETLQQQAVYGGVK